MEVEGLPIVESPAVKLLGSTLTITCPVAFRNLGFCRKLYTPQQLLLLYKAQIRPSLEYCSHVTSTLWNELPRNLFPNGYNLQRFKSNEQKAELKIH
nr:unnamed protein product [Callosobruchus analis]